MLSTNYKENRWTPEEDKILREAVAKFGTKNQWQNISAYLPGRTNKSCRKRWIHSLDPSLRRGRWTAEEDSLLRQAVERFQGRHWWKIAQCVPGRTDDQCAKRWREKLDPSISVRPWTTEEDTELLKAHQELGPRWNTIAMRFPGRPAVYCRNRFQSLQKIHGSKAGMIPEKSHAVKLENSYHHGANHPGNTNATPHLNSSPMSGLLPKDISSSSSSYAERRTRSTTSASSYAGHCHRNSIGHDSGSTASSSPFSSCSSSFMPSPSSLPLEIEQDPLITSVGTVKPDFSMLPLPPYGTYSSAPSTLFLHSPYSTTTTISSSASSRQSAGPDSPLTHHHHPSSSTSPSPSPSSFEGIGQFPMIHDDAGALVAISGAVGSLPSSVSTGTATTLTQPPRSLLPGQHHPQFHADVAAHPALSHLNSCASHTGVPSLDVQQNRCTYHQQQHHRIAGIGGQQEQSFCLDSQCLAAYTSSLMGWDGQFNVSFS